MAIHTPPITPNPSPSTRSPSPNPTSPSQTSIEEPPTLCCIFSDLPDSTELWELSEPLMAPSHNIFYTTMRTLIPRFSGTEVKNLGDGFFITFPSAILALRFCLSVQRTLSAITWPKKIVEFRRQKDLEKGIPPAKGKGITTRLGIHFGAPYESHIDPVSQRMDYHGNMVNLAARIMAQAKGDEIAVSDAVILALIDENFGSDLGGAVVLDRVQALDKVLRDEGETGFVVVRKGYSKLKGIAHPHFITVIRLKR
ncbi:hypothetical protein EG329_006020 [Mollisiaceae sp. DMI_Dod_QoI]|nr:hypothetical protein EG329_006020 [Helotiales sp. DMI_Dod_QoI]